MLLGLTTKNAPFWSFPFALVELFAWDERDFERFTEGSAIQRIGHARWLQNIAVALGNAPSIEEVVSSLRSRLDHPSALVREHVGWALDQHTEAARTE